MDAIASVQPCATEDPHSPAGHTIEAVDAGTQPPRWAVLTSQAFKRLSDMIFETQSGSGPTDGEAGDMLDGALSTLYYAAQVSETNGTLFPKSEPSHCISLLRSARAQLLLCAQACGTGPHPLNDLEAAVLPSATALVEELIVALTAVALDDADLARLEAFASFRPALAAKAAPQRRALTKDATGAYTSAQISHVLDYISAKGDTLCTMLEYLAEDAEDEQHRSQIRAASALAEMIAAAADTANGSDWRSGFEGWLYGPGFGKVGAA